MGKPLHPGQLVMCDIADTVLTPATADFLRRNHIRAICLFARNFQDMKQIRRLCADLRDVMGSDALIAVDQEGGAVLRSLFVPQAPSAMGLGAANDTQLAQDVGAAIGRGLKAMGININLGPVLDLNNNPHNPVIGERSFGAEPSRAIELARAWMTGSHASGVACCIKHFPGHGDTHVDSHLDLPTVDKPLAAIEALELKPFHALRDAPMLMSAHIIYPALDAEWPATLSRRILTDLLRTQWGYKGVVITDGLNMKAIDDRYRQTKAAARALVAGADLALVLGHPSEIEGAIQEIQAVMDSGELPAEQALTSVARINVMAGLYPILLPDYSTAQEQHDRGIMQQAWMRALSVIGNPTIPAIGSRVRLIAQQDVPCDGISEPGIRATVLAERLRTLYDVDLWTFDSPEQFDWASLPADGRVNILASTTRKRYGPREQATFHPDLHLVLWNPFVVMDIAAPALVTFGFRDAALNALLETLNGHHQPLGIPPVALTLPSNNLTEQECLS
ncbi:beta-N-acetylhexosaminidase [Chitinivorax tropicus]|uniref:Beta-N-acetylhexosaminidase n=1 Tax=Chitinivorax tropicus TaxID=714531 RepID=A0A840MNF5_9PROT|nr:beta-N-acetylhexosaminidase [Chitinivorax tropicus]MBB5018629.1 beta-N-acetylhexosaminidase [Chitinivorax tropicus]